MKKALVTGGTGFLGLQLIFRLLQDGYDVRTIIRKESGKQRILKVLQDNGIKNTDKLSFVEADLLSDNNWDEAMKDIEYVFSVASPVFFNKPKDESDAIQPALQGILRILSAANNAGVKKVVMTSNFGAVGFSKTKGVTTERDWTDPEQKGLSIYEKSKLLAEKAAWGYVREPDVNLEFATVNPVAIFGPALDQHVSGSFDLLKNILNGNKMPDFDLNVVDVRDVVDIQIRAMENSESDGQRFIASADGKISMKEIALLIKKERPTISDKINVKPLPSWIVKIGALFNKTAREGQLMLDMNREVSNQKAKNVLGWTPIADNRAAVLSAVDSLGKD